MLDKGTKMEVFDVEADDHTHQVRELLRESEIKVAKFIYGLKTQANSCLNKTCEDKTKRI